MTFETKDSGERSEYASGMRRDTDSGKPRYDLIDMVFLRRWAELMARGAAKYGERNWELAESDEEYARFKASAFRHFMAWFAREDDEDHGAAVAFNIAAAEMVDRRLGVEMEAGYEALAESGWPTEDLCANGDHWVTSLYSRCTDCGA